MMKWNALNTFSMVGTETKNDARVRRFTLASANIIKA